MKAAPSQGKRIRRHGARREVDLLRRSSRELEDVLCGFVTDDIDDVVHRHDADELVRSIDDRDGEQVVARDNLGHLLLIRLGSHADRLGDHQIAQLFVGWLNDQLSQGQHADQVAAVVDHVDVKAGLVVAVPLQPLDGLLTEIVSDSAKYSGDMIEPAESAGWPQEHLDILRKLAKTAEISSAASRGSSRSSSAASSGGMGLSSSARRPPRGPPSAPPGQEPRAGLARRHGSPCRQSDRRRPAGPRSSADRGHARCPPGGSWRADDPRVPMRLGAQAGAGWPAARCLVDRS